MALVDYCNLGSHVNLKPFQNEDESVDHIKIDMNLTNPTQLALPPLGNVSICATSKINYSLDSY